MSKINVGTEGSYIMLRFGNWDTTRLLNKCRK